MLRCNGALLLPQPNLRQFSLLQRVPPTLCSLSQGGRQHPCCCLWLDSLTEFLPRLPPYMPVFQKSRGRDSRRLRAGLAKHPQCDKRIGEIKSLIGKRTSAFPRPPLRMAPRRPRPEVPLTGKVIFLPLNPPHTIRTYSGALQFL